MHISLNQHDTCKCVFFLLLSRFNFNALACSAFPIFIVFRLEWPANTLVASNSTEEIGNIFCSRKMSARCPQHAHVEQLSLSSVLQWFYLSLGGLKNNIFLINISLPIITVNTHIISKLFGIKTSFYSECTFSTSDSDSNIWFFCFIQYNTEK